MWGRFPLCSGVEFKRSRGVKTQSRFLSGVGCYEGKGGGGVEVQTCVKSRDCGETVTPTENNVRLKCILGSLLLSMKSKTRVFVCERFINL